MIWAPRVMDGREEMNFFSGQSTMHLGFEPHCASVSVGQVAISKCFDYYGNPLREPVDRGKITFASPSFAHSEVGYGWRSENHPQNFYHGNLTFEPSLPPPTHNNHYQTQHYDAQRSNHSHPSTIHESPQFFPNPRASDSVIPEILVQLQALRKIGVQRRLSERFVAEQQVWATQQKTIDKYIEEQLAAMESLEMEQTRLDEQTRTRKGELGIFLGAHKVFEEMPDRKFESFQMHMGCVFDKIKVNSLLIELISPLLAIHYNSTVELCTGIGISTSFCDHLRCPELSTVMKFYVQVIESCGVEMKGGYVANVLWKLFFDLVAPLIDCFKQEGVVYTAKPCGHIDILKAQSPPCNLFSSKEMSDFFKAIKVTLHDYLSSLWEKMEVLSPPENVYGVKECRGNYMSNGLNSRNEEVVTLDSSSYGKAGQHLPFKHHEPTAGNVMSLGGDNGVSVVLFLIGFGTKESMHEMAIPTVMSYSSGELAYSKPVVVVLCTYHQAQQVFGKIPWPKRIGIFLCLYELFWGNKTDSLGENLIDQGELEGGRHYTLRKEPIVKHCYLLAGKLESRNDKCFTRSCHVMYSPKAAMKWDEDVLSLEYDLDLFTVVVILEFYMGAMENRSLNIFNSTLAWAFSETASDGCLRYNLLLFNSKSCYPHFCYRQWLCGLYMKDLSRREPFLIMISDAFLVKGSEFEGSFVGDQVQYASLGTSLFYGGWSTMGLVRHDLGRKNDKKMVMVIDYTSKNKLLQILATGKYLEHLSLPHIIRDCPTCAEFLERRINMSKLALNVLDMKSLKNPTTTQSLHDFFAQDVLSIVTLLDWVLVVLGFQDWARRVILWKNMFWLFKVTVEWVVGLLAFYDGLFKLWRSSSTKLEDKLVVRGMVCHDRIMTLEGWAKRHRFGRGKGATWTTPFGLVVGAIGDTPPFRVYCASSSNPIAYKANLVAAESNNEHLSISYLSIT